MAKEVFLGVAGSGKTKMIIDRLDSDRRFLILTYTQNNLENIRKRVFEKFEDIPKNITLMTYFNFAYTFCFKPQLAMRLRSKGISYKIPKTKGINGGQIQFYMDKHRRLYGCRIGKLLMNEQNISGLCNQVIEKGFLINAIKARIEKYYDELIVDEVQDLAGHDFNFMLEIVRCNISILMVGDFYQHTFDTSRDGNVNKNLYNNYDEYKRKFIDAGLSVDCEKLSKSYRFGAEVCSVIKDKLGITILSHENQSTGIKYIEECELIDKIMFDDNIIKLFYKENYKYNCKSINWGNSKGLQYKQICIILIKAVCGEKIAPQTRNKLYVALTRASGCIYLLKDFKNIKSRYLSN